ncbi:MAG: HAMP domain-containing protein [Thermodesulfobacteriota bacterium]
MANLTGLANRISVGNLEIEIPKESKDEIGALAEAFERMRVSMVFAIKQLRKK